MEMTEKKMVGTNVKKTAGKIGLGLFIYLLLSTLPSTILEVYTKYVSLSEMAKTDLTAIAMIIGVILGTGFLFLLFKPQQVHKQFFVKESKMTVSSFFMLLCLMMGCQLVFSAIAPIMEYLFNLIGLSTTGSIESVVTFVPSISMILYVGIIGPIIEEIIYRGFVFRSLSQYNKVFAILASSLLFGIMHSNLPQIVFATFVGLVLGYIACEYSMIWSIIFHIINNLIFNQLFTVVINNFDEVTQNVIHYVVFGLFFLGAVVSIIINRYETLSYLKQLKWKLPYMRWTFSRVFMIIFVAISLIFGIMMLQPIQ